MHSIEQLRSGALAGVRRLDLSCGLTEFPPEIFDLADSLEVLNLTGNALSSLPDDLPRLHRLRVIFCSDNRFEHLPGVLGACGQLEMVGFKANRIRQVPAEALPPRLRWLILTDNAIETLPATLGERPRLEKLMLAGNRLAVLPDLSGCEQLALLRIAANHFESWPSWLTSMPRLAWLGTAGNRLFHKVIHTTPDFHIERISWGDLQIHSLIGEGASGVIHRADWTRPGSIFTDRTPTGIPADMPVAVKLFKGAMTSDGLPECEMAACLAASGHPNLVGVEGLVHNHPDGRPGLVLPLLDTAFRPLASPPSLASCSRDVVDPGLRLPVDRVAGTAHAVASAVAHLHGRGLMHGDLYGHNILWNGADRALLSDFGAASFLPPDDAHLSTALQRLEVRAFGCLLEELVEAAEDPGDTRLVMLAALRDECLQPQVSARPLFSAIERRLVDFA